MGRPKIEFDETMWKQISEMCRIHCTKQEISDIIGVSEDTIEKRIKEEYDCTFTVFYKRFSAQGRMSLRRMQWETAESGNPTMQIWLGKQELGQRDKHDQEITIDSKLNKMDSIIAQINDTD